MDNYLKVLMIDDDQDDHDLFRLSLKDFKLNGFRISDITRITSVYNGNEGLDYLLNRAEYSNLKDHLPDLIVLDLNMPLMDGFTVLQEISKMSEINQIPVYVLTTTSDEQYRQKCLKYSNCAGFFSKPSAKAGIKDIIAKMLDVYSV